MEQNYHPPIVEKQAQAFWVEKKTFEVKEDLSTEKFYCLSMLPYPSGQLHMGHVRNYTIGDTISRYQGLLGKNVLQPMGWDAFGLPAENAALQHQVAPSKWTYQNIEQMRTQLQDLGFAIDWKREFATCDPEYYHWEQWLFVRLYKKGLAYQKTADVNWDPVDQTVLANEQVVNGCGWRSGAPVERRKIKQWFLKITDYADELLNDLDTLEGWPEQVRTMQRNWIGRSEGVEIQFEVADTDHTLSVFTTRADTLFGVSFMAIAPGHPLATQAAEQNAEIQQFIHDCQHTKVAEADMATMEKRGIQTPFFAINPINQQPIPIWITNYVLMEYGTGAVMAVPAHDERDHEFACKYQLTIPPVIQPEDGVEWDYSKGAYIGPGNTIHSGEYDGLDKHTAIQRITETLVQNQQGQSKIHYRLRDWGVSRQRYWGAPIPMIHCEQCGVVPVPEEDLPVVLPQDVVLNDPGSPLKDIPEFYQVDCPDCGRSAVRETDTFDTFMESSWYYTRYCCHDQNSAMLDDRAKYWTPVDHYIGGIEHAVMHLLYARFMHKLLRDEGLVNSKEPFTNLLTQGMVLKDGAKMSKSKGNTVSPQEFIERYGADTVRLFTIFAAPPEQSLEWSDSGVEGGYRFLRRLWTLCYTHHALLTAQNQLSSTRFDWSTADDNVLATRRSVHKDLQQANQDMLRNQFNTVVSACMKICNTLGKVDAQSDAEKALVVEGIRILLVLLNPITPHITHYLWRELGYGDDISQASWPKEDSKALKSESIELIVQINGKRRGQIHVPADAEQDDIEALALQDEKIAQHLADTSPKKIIVVPKRLVNIVV